MNKTILIAGGASVASLAVGGAAGYFYSKRRWQDHFLKELDYELNQAQKVFALQLMEAREGKPASLADVPVSDPELDLEDDEPDDDVILKQNADVAIKNYQSYAESPKTDGIEHNNIFGATTPAKKLLPPRDDSGKFRPRLAASEPVEPVNGQPYLISDDDFLANRTDYEQVYLYYWVKEDTLTLVHEVGETLDNAIVGEENLKKFPKVLEGEERRIFVRNDQVEIDYEILMQHDSLTEYIGLQES